MRNDRPFIKLTQFDGSPRRLVRQLGLKWEDCGQLMETLNDLNKLKFYGERQALVPSSASDRPTVAFLRPRLHVLYETSADDLPDSFRELLTQVSKTFDEK